MAGLLFLRIVLVWFKFMCLAETIFLHENVSIQWIVYFNYINLSRRA